MTTSFRSTIHDLRSAISPIKLSLLIILFLLLYFGLYHSTVFVQDDWFHLSQTSSASLTHILKHFNPFSSNSPDPYNYYRPLSSKLSFYLLFQLFALNPTFYILTNLTLHGINTYLVTRLAKHFNLSPILTAFFYLASASHFTLTSYPTNIEVLIFTFFTLLTLLTYLKKKTTLSLITLILAFMSRESAIIIPLLILSYQFFNPTSKKSPLLNLRSTLYPLRPTLSLSLLYLAFRALIYGWPDQGEVYTLTIGSHIFTNTLKYLSWNLNITGLLKTYSILSTINFLSLTAFFIILFSSLTKLSTIYNLRSTIFSLILWLLPLLPVLFFPDHLDPWNLNLSAAGLAILLTLTTTKLKPKLH